VAPPLQGSLSYTDRMGQETRGRKSKTGAGDRSPAEPPSYGSQLPQGLCRRPRQRLHSPPPAITFSLLLRGLEELLRALLAELIRIFEMPAWLTPKPGTFFTDDS